MTKYEKLVVSAYTGVLMVGFDDFHSFIEKLLGRPIFTHELADEKITNEIKEMIKPAFLGLCKHTDEYPPLVSKE